MVDNEIIILIESQTMVIQYSEDPILLDCDAVTEQVFPKILKTHRAFKKMETTRPTHHVPKVLNLQQCHCKNTKFYIQYFLLQEFPWLIDCFFILSVVFQGT
jgi:hypothetical protein